jgi:NTE family protein
MILENAMSLPPLGIALSGGTAKSVTHVGVLKAISEAQVPVSYIVGTSGGSMVGTMFATGMPISTLEGIATTMSWRKLVSIKLTRLGFISSERIEDFMRDTIGDLDFDDLTIPCGVVAADLQTGEKRVFSSGPVARAVRASCSIPQIYLPVEIDGHYYVDGGLAEYLPAESLHEMGCDFVVGVNLAPHEDVYRRPHHILQLIIQLTGLMARKNLAASLQHADVVVHPNIDRFSAFDFDNAAEMIQVGYDTTRRTLDRLHRVWQDKGGLRARLVRRLKRHSI